MNGYHIVRGGVGVVESSGGGLLGWFRKGKRVAVINDRVGNWGEYTVTRSRQVIPVPDDIPDEQAATFFVNPATALAMTRLVLRVPPGEWLLQSAAGGELGKMVIRLGRKYGFRTVNTVRRREQVEELKRLGADAVLVESDGPIDGQVKDLTDGAGVKYEFENYPGAVHSFTVKGADKHEVKGMAYNEAADKKSWELTMALFKETLGK